MKSKLMMLLSFLIIGMGVASAQTKKITGKVVDEDGEPVIGAMVKIPGHAKGTVTDLNGQFVINVPESTEALSFSFVGLVPRTMKVEDKMKVVMTADNTVLSDIVVTAYGSQSKQSLTGSVAQLETKDIEKRIGSNVMGALEGAAPGVQVNNTYGEPGSSPSIRVRGFSSVTGSNAPLYVVDGVPFDGDFGTDINPADIESMTVLKDAASAALYGNRAANGVVLITTKKAKYAQKPTIEVSVNHGWYNRGIKEYERLGADEWMEAEWLALRNSQVSSQGMSVADANAYATANLVSSSIGRNIYDAPSDKLFDENGKLIASRMAGYTDTDWQDAIERTGQRQEYSVSGALNGEKYNLYASMGYLNEQGYVVATDLERYTGRINSMFQPTGWFKGGINLTASHSTNSYNSNANGSYYANSFYMTRYMAPVYPVYQHDKDGNIVRDANGKPVYDTTSPYLSNRNVVYEREVDYERNTRNTLGMQGFATFMLPYGINATVKADINHIQNNYSKFNNPEIGDGATNGGRLNNAFYRYQTWTVQELLNWNYDFGMHNVDLMLGHENYGYTREYNTYMKTSMSVPGLYVASNFTNTSYVEGYNDNDRTESYIGRARYNYNEKYYAEVSFRRDGSSRFYKDNRWGNFYSVGASWNMKREAWLADVKWVNHLKLRASYGEVGNNSGSGFYGYMALYELDKNGGNPALLKKQLAANDVTWETTRTLDLGIDAVLFDRLNVSVGYFDKRSTDLLFNVPLPLSAGSWSHGDSWNMSQLMNVGEVSNSGIELAIDGDIVKTKNWKWNLGIDATFMKNEIKKLYNGEDILNGTQNFSEGHSIYEWYTYHFAGVDQMTGFSLYDLDPDKKAKCEEGGALVTINGVDYTTQNSFALRDWRGSALPDVYGAIKSYLSYKDLALDVTLTYSLGGKCYDGGYASLMGVSNSGASGNAIHKDALKGWKQIPEGMTVDSPDRLWVGGTPALNFTQSSYSNGVSDRWLTDASYLVCKNINLSYSLPKTLIKQFGLEGLTVNAGVENLFTITARQGLNPQYSFNGAFDDTYVTARVWNLGLKLRF